MRGAGFENEDVSALEIALNDDAVICALIFLLVSICTFVIDVFFNFPTLVTKIVEIVINSLSHSF